MILLIDDQRKSHLVLNHVVVSPLCFVPTYFSYPCLEPISKKVLLGQMLSLLQEGLVLKGLNAVVDRQVRLRQLEKWTQLSRLPCFHFGDFISFI